MSEAINGAAAPDVKFVPGVPFLSFGTYDLAALGYEAREYFVSGTATQFGLDGARGQTAPYVTRMVVAAPVDKTRFSGTVVVEWLNVSGGRDAAVEWTMAHRAMVREGYVFVGVSAQKVGIDGGLSLATAPMTLKEADPARYGGLSHPGDEYSYDIFSQAGAALRTANMLGDLVPARLLAVGVSQGAMYLATYAQVADPGAGVYDGFLVHSRFGYGAGLGGHSVLQPSPETALMGLQMRKDLRVPVLTLETETDVLGGPALGFYASRQAEGTHLRIWEIAGTAHADNYVFYVGGMDSGFASIEALAAAWAPMPGYRAQGMRYPMNFGPMQHYTAQAALVALDHWVKTGTAPPIAAPLLVPQAPAPGEVPQVARDAHGIALGGVRTPWVDVPTSRLAGEGNEGSPGAWIVGLGEPFDAEKLAGLYPGGREEYLWRFGVALAEAVAAGFILASDQQEILDLAAASCGL